MAGVGFTCDSGAIALVASTAATALQIVAGANTRAQLKRLDISSNGITPTDPGILIDVLTQTSAGTMAALTPVKRLSTDTETLQTTAQKNSAGAEPTAGNILFSFYYNEQTWVPMIFDPPLPIPGGTRLGIRPTPGTLTAATKIVVSADCEE